MHQKLLDVPNCEVYLDDTVEYSDKRSCKDDRFQGVFKRLTATSLTLNLAKCEFAEGIVMYSGKQVGQVVVKLVEAKISTILEFLVLSCNK